MNSELCSFLFRDEREGGENFRARIPCEVLEANKIFTAFQGSCESSRGRDDLETFGLLVYRRGANLRPQRHDDGGGKRVGKSENVTYCERRGRCPSRLFLTRSRLSRSLSLSAESILFSSRRNLNSTRTHARFVTSVFAQSRRPNCARSARRISNVCISLRFQIRFS